MKSSLKTGQKVKCMLKNYGWVSGIYEGDGISSFCGWEHIMINPTNLDYCGVSIVADSISNLNGRILKDGSIYLSTKNYKIEDARII
ncbi:hypothetical protein [Clostridium sp. ZBS18]|uniref:hypothetical protein n=1 Tax=Clostridium sp. ZBS18 TaxID=2949967 RepID=UPI00207B03EE|nr:hypothetical protein [Clostridium sp. ZBS18]